MPLTEMERGSGLAVALDLINTWDELVAEPDLLRDAGWLRRWLTWHGFPVAAASIRNGDLEPARDLRESLTAAFDAADEASSVPHPQRARGHGGNPAGARAGRGRLALPHLARRACRPRLRGRVRHVGLLEAVRDGSFGRFGRCAGAPCTCVFVDRSRNRSRRYCCQLCADRVAQAAYRARKRG